MDTLQGKKVVLYAKSAAIDEYKPFGCSQSVTLRAETEMLDTTTVGSGFWKSIKPRISGWSISLAGVTLLRDLATSRFFALDLITEQVRLNGLFLKIIFTDEGAFTRNFTGFAYIPLSEIVSTAGQLSKFSCEFIGSKDFILDDPSSGVGPGIEPFSDYWTTTPTGTSISGTSFVHSYSLIGKQVLEVDREGTEWDLTLSAPVGRQARFNSGTGVVDFDPTLPFNPGETIFVLFK